VSWKYDQFTRTEISGLTAHQSNAIKRLNFSAPKNEYMITNTFRPMPRISQRKKTARRQRKFTYAHTLSARKTWTEARTFFPIHLFLWLVKISTTTQRERLADVSISRQKATILPINRPSVVKCVQNRSWLGSFLVIYGLRTSFFLLPTELNVGRQPF
jgi:hypothetical protein